MIKDLKELDKFFKICRKQGVADISFEGLSVKFGELPVKNGPQIEEEDETEIVPTEEQLMFYHVPDTGQL